MIISALGRTGTGASRTPAPSGVEPAGTINGSMGWKTLPTAISAWASLLSAVPLPVTGAAEEVVSNTESPSV